MRRHWWAWKQQRGRWGPGERVLCCLNNNADADGRFSSPHLSRTRRGKRRGPVCSTGRTLARGRCSRTRSRRALPPTHRRSRRLSSEWRRAAVACA